VYERSPEESGFPGLAAARYKLPRDRFEALLANLAGARSAPPVLLPAAPGGGPDRGLPFAMTVDDGGLSYYTIVADRLEALGWRGHCLVTTDYVGRRGFLDRRQLRELHARGHVIGSHSASHPRRLSACSWPAMLREWTDSRQVLAHVLGADVVVGSVPGGFLSERVARAAGEAGLRVLFTSEPRTRVDQRAGCALVGRFTIRPGQGLDVARRLATGDRSVRGGQWLSWNVKKLLKTCLGERYVRLARRGDPAASGPDVVGQREGRNRSCV
jgi:peptidoglycan/xylan/chitin deacetylase (PgdA/CDA1 family)